MQDQSATAWYTAPDLVPVIPLNVNYFHESKNEISTYNKLAVGETMPVPRCCLTNAAYTLAGITFDRHTIQWWNGNSEHIDPGITLANAINFLVEKYELVRIDRRGFSRHEQTPYLTIIDIMRARRDLGLMNRN